MNKPHPERKIYITLVGSAPMASLDALILSLERFRDILSSDSAKDSFETAVRSIQPDLKSVHAFVEAVYAKKDPRFAVTMKGRTMVIEIDQTPNDFYDCIHDQDIEDILSHVTAVGSMPATRLPTQKIRDYTVFPVKYIKGKFTKPSGSF